MLSFLTSNALYVRRKDGVLSFFPSHNHSRAFHGDLNEVKKNYPSTFEQPLEVVRKLGFPDVIFPGE